MFVMTDKEGCNFKNDPSLSSASATKYSPFPNFALVENLFNIPPTIKVGSNLASVRIEASILVVVVFP